MLLLLVTISSTSEWKYSSFLIIWKSFLARIAVPNIGKTSVYKVHMILTKLISLYQKTKYLLESYAKIG